MWAKDTSEELLRPQQSPGCCGATAAAVQAGRRCGAEARPRRQHCRDPDGVYTPLAWPGWRREAHEDPGEWQGHQAPGGEPLLGDVWVPPSKFKELQIIAMKCITLG